MNKWKHLVKEWKRYWFLPVMVLVGILMVMGAKNPPRTAETVESFSDQQYITDLELRVENMLSGIEGVGRCKVTLILSSGMQKEYVREEGTVLVIKDKSGNEEPVISGERYPEISGVTVLCDQAENTKIRTEIIRSVSTLLDVGTNKIYVISGKGTYDEDQ